MFRLTFVGDYFQSDCLWVIFQVDVHQELSSEVVVMKPEQVVSPGQSRELM